jgi:heparosan-N-sulfate-glucuronate 5-epimerase
MGLIHKFKKFSIYFMPGKPYWRSIEHNTWKVDSPLGPFLDMHLKDRLIDHHYDKFDEGGLPIRMDKDQVLYNYTTIFSYALANWERYLETADKDFIKPLWNALDFLKREHETTDYGGIVFPFKGALSAMNQGEALSVIARCYELNPDPDLKVLSEKIIKAYSVPVADYGVLGKFGSLNEVYWYEEKATLPGRHILNGMCYALVGLYDIKKAMPDLGEAERLWLNGIEYLKKALPLFDEGYWSWYWIDEDPPHYVASMMYHNLHVIQLKYLFKITGEDELKLYADRFDLYKNKLNNRMRAGIELIKGKSRG